MNKNGYQLPKKVGIVYSEVKREYFPTEDQYITEKNAVRDAKIISSYIEKLGIIPILLAGDDKLPYKLKKSKPDVILNLVASVRGQEYLSAGIPGILEVLKIPYTGSGILGESLSYNKFLVKKLLQQNGIPVPNFQLFNSARTYIDPSLRFPLISKLNEVHGAVEINESAVSENEKSLRARVAFLVKTYDQPVIVEEFIVGKEITSYLLEGLNKKVYLAERIVKNVHGKYALTTFEDIWIDKDPDSILYEKYTDPILREYVKKAFLITEMADYGKFDVKIDSSGRYFFIDSNSNPLFGPKEIESALAYVLEMYGVSFVEILKRLLLNTVRDSQGKERIPIVDVSYNHRQD